MEIVEQNGKKILLFEDSEELKWFFHRRMCKGEPEFEFYMNLVMEEDLRDNPTELNEYLAKTFRKEGYRVKEG